MNAPIIAKPRVSTLAPAIFLFFLAPLVAEYLLGDLPITLLPALIVLAPMYGAGALLIREIVRATGRGWPSILLLGGAYAILEEAFTTQSLFNPDYLHLHMGLLNAGYIPALGMGAWWTLWMLNVHPVWSIATPIVLAEGLFPDRAHRPWLGPIGRVIVCIVFAFGLVASTVIGWRQDHFLARPFQFAIGGVLIAAFVCAALLIQHGGIATAAILAPGPWIAGICALVAASAGASHQSRMRAGGICSACSPSTQSFLSSLCAGPRQRMGSLQVLLSAQPPPLPMRGTASFSRKSSASPAPPS